MYYFILELGVKPRTAPSLSPTVSREQSRPSSSSNDNTVSEIPRQGVQPKLSKVIKNPYMCVPGCPKLPFSSQGNIAELFSCDPQESKNTGFEGREEI